MKSLRYLYKIGRGPSSSHTMGPEKACRIFLKRYPQADEYEATLLGSLSATGKGHLTDEVIRETFAPGKVTVIFGDTDESKLLHPNTLILKAKSGGSVLGESEVYSVGGGEIVFKGEKQNVAEEIYPHKTFDEIKEFCIENSLKLWQYAEIFEGGEIWNFLQNIWENMQNCVLRGLKTDGVLSGGLNTRRKAKILYDQYVLNEDAETRENRLLCAYAYAASEENASGGVVVTAPTCGSCGVLPAVFYYLKNKKDVPDKEILKGLATAGIIGNVVKTNASISGAECGCQAEVGVACAMASAAIAQIKGMSLDQIEYAAEIAVEHHLGLTCDPVCGLVQIPCIERNAVAALRALNEVTLASFLSDTRKITFDTAVKTMYETGRDLRTGYRETATGGLAKLYSEK
ncbi:MAG: L-serine ammonia-lyase, iron-sulfur-dependent, subunit alpha [Candidatus Borkfalkiaceae bacterium]|nr:L-serine ammonia-lyase, iron-sulfur-dependent, subunit alpha [Christensenellaceae bacterium]